MSSMSSDQPPTPPTTEPTAAGDTTTEPAPPGGSHRRALDDFFDRIRGLGVVRRSEGSWAGGVAGGLARRWDVDVVLIRGAFVALTLMGGVGVVAYGLAWLLLPQEDGRIHLQSATRGHVTAGFIGAALLSLSAFGGGGPGPWHDGYWFGWGFPGGLVVSLLIVLGIYWYARRESSGPRPPNPPVASSPTHVYGSAIVTEDPDRRPFDATWPTTPSTSPSTWEHVRDTRPEPRPETRQFYDRRAVTKPSRPVVRVTLGVALLAAAIVFFLGNRAGWDASPAVIAAATALGVIAAGVLVSGFLGRRSAGLAGLGLLLAVVTLAGAGASNAGVDSGQNVTPIGQRTWRPAGAAAAEKQFNLGIGEATLYLTDPAILAGGGEVDVTVRTGIGHTTIVLPDDVASRVDVRLSVGQLNKPDGSTQSVEPDTGNHRQSVTAGPAGPPRLVVDVRHGVGELDITTAARLAAGTGVTPTPTTTPTPSVTPTVTPSVTATTN